MRAFASVVTAALLAASVAGCNGDEQCYAEFQYEINDCEAGLWQCYYDQDLVGGDQDVCLDDREYCGDDAEAAFVDCFGTSRLMRAFWLCYDDCSTLAYCWDSCADEHLQHRASWYDKQCEGDCDRDLEDCWDWMNEQGLGWDGDAECRRELRDCKRACYP